MNLGLTEVSTDSFLQRATPPLMKRMNALVVTRDEFERTNEELHEKLSARSIPVTDVPLDPGLSSWLAKNVRGNQNRAFLLATKSGDENLWRTVDRNRSGLEKASTLLFLLSEEAAQALPHAAPHLMSSIGPMYKRIDTHLAKAVADARAARYPELYEAADSRKERELDEAVRDIITALGDPCTDDRAWRRLGFIGRSMLVEVVPTIAAYWPPGLAAASAVSASLDAWLSSLSAPVVIKNLPKKPLAPQALSEAMIVIEEAARLMERSQSQNALSEILDAIFQGYALFPGSEGRRELFDWWLEDVVPAAADLQVPPPFGRRVKPD